MKYTVVISALLLATSTFGQMTVTLTPSDYNGYGVSFFGANNGSVDLTVIGGTPPFTYQWSNDETTQDISNLAAGYYEVVVTDANGEELDDRVTLEAPEELQVFVDMFEYQNEYNVGCHGCYDGSIWVSAVGGLGPYSFLWDDGVTSASRYGLGAGSYQVTVTDANGSTVESEHVEMRQPERDDWTMYGNAGTNPAYQFIGTSDNQDVVFKSNNTERLRILSNGDVKLTGLTPIESPLYVDDQGILRAGAPPPPLVPPAPVTPCGIHYPTFWRSDGNYFPSIICNEDPVIGTRSSNPLIFIANDQQHMRLTADGKLGIGMIPPAGPIDKYRLYVQDGIVTRDVLVLSGPWPDFVFDEEYELLPLVGLRKFIHLNGHLPGVPSAAEVAKNQGVEVGDMQRRLLRTVEEQALYILQLEELLQGHEQRLRNLETAK